MESSNPYEGTPFYIAQVNPATGRHTRAFFFLGAAPRAVLEAARRGRPQASDVRVPEWSASDAKVLRGYYGPRWRTMLIPKDPPEAGADQGFAASLQRGAGFFHGDSGGYDDGDGGLFRGGAAADDDADGDIDFGDLGAFDSEDAPQLRADDQGTFDNDLRGVRGLGRPVYTDIAVYPEDTIHDLKHKLHVASGVPLCRQHLFYYVNKEGPVVPYRVTVDSAPIAVDWRQLGAAPSGDSSALAGRMNIDSRLESRREGLYIEALDTFTKLSFSPNVRVTGAYFVDLYSIIPPLGSPERPRDNLASILRDRYQFDLLYYGALVQYWPQLSPDACHLALSEPSRMHAVYPNLSPNPRTLAAQFEAERTVAMRAIRWRPGAAKGARHTTAVTSATVRVAPTAVRTRVVVRNVFDWMPTSVGVAAITARFEVDSALLTAAGAGALARQGDAVQVTATKRHASSYSPNSIDTIGRFIGRLPRRDSAGFALARAVLGDDDANLAPGRVRGKTPYAFLSVGSDGRYEASADLREDDRVSFATAAAEIAEVIAPTIDAINAMGAAALPIGGELGDPKRGPLDVALGAITASAFWPHAMTEATFREIKRRFRVYEKAGIVGIRGLQQAGAYTFNFRKGIVAYDPRLAVRAEAGGHVAQGSARNQYAWLTSGPIAGRWSAFFQGRVVRIHHRATDLRVEIVGADGIAEFNLIRRYVFSFLDSLLVGRDRIREGDTASRGSEAQRKGPVASHRLRRLQERDPDLFDLKKYDRDATVYSVLCQSGRQPHVYNEAESKQLSARRRARLVRYWNFTENTPALYECPNPKYPHLSFRANAHPSGYCLPCCKKASTLR